MQEIWKDIKGYEGLYQVSNLGKVKSLRKNRMLTIQKNRGGYNYITLSFKGYSKIMTIHRLVAQAFVPNPNNYAYINHKDENKENNMWTNLEWCTHKYNCNYGTRNERKAKKKMISINQYDLNGNFIKKWNSIKEANIKYNNYHISQCCSGKRKTAGGYIWKYANK